MRAPPCLEQGSNDCFTRLGGTQIKKYDYLKGSRYFFVMLSAIVIYASQVRNRYVCCFLSLCKNTISIGADANADRI